MSEHNKIQELLTLAAAGALGSSDEQRVDEHLRSCAICLKEIAAWQAIAADLRRLPTPEAPARLVERTRWLAEASLEEQAEHRWQNRVMALVVTFAWLLTILSWPLVRLVSGSVLGLLDPHLNRSWISFAGFTALVWLAGGTAAVLLSRQERRERRLA
ncbi:MAG TPA: zf-HC2 domain-containing protein [Candidatus Cybelea sp.]|nr:zf-HC2 domain-containing protein [Candidatus Cybelea sp.]